MIRYGCNKIPLFPTLTVDQSDRIMSRETAVSEMISSQPPTQSVRPFMKALCEGTETVNQS